MTVLDFIFGIFLVIIVAIMFIAWLGAKYDFVGRDEKIEELKLELELIKKKEERRKKRKIKKGKGDTNAKNKNK